MHLDVIVIGSGPGGYRAATLAATHGLKVGLVEKAEWGGCGLHRGCIPKQNWYHTAQLLAASRQFNKRGISGTLSGDLAAAWDHQKKTAKSIREVYLAQLKQLGVSGFAATAAFVDAHTLALDGRDQLSADHFVIATGGYPYVPKPFHLTEGKVLTSDELFSQPPPAGKRVALIGSGAVATEFAFILAQLGCEVSWVAQNPPLSQSAFSEAARALLLERLKQLGIEPRIGQRAEAVEILPDGVKLLMPNGSGEIVVDWVLLGCGRRPHTNSLILDAAGVNTDSKGFIKVNEFLQTSQPHIYAVGDVANSRMTANQATADASIAISNIVTPGTRKQDRSAVPDTLYSALELARVGTADAQAAPAGSAAFSSNARALVQGEDSGFVHLYTDARSGALTAAEMVGTQAGELIHLAAQTLGHADALKLFSEAAYAHPARAEELLRAAAPLALFMPPAERLVVAK